MGERRLLDHPARPFPRRFPALRRGRMGGRIAHPARPSPRRLPPSDAPHRWLPVPPPSRALHPTAFRTHRGLPFHTVSRSPPRTFARRALVAVRQSARSDPCGTSAGT